MTNQECLVKAVQIGKADLIPLILESITHYDFNGEVDYKQWLEDDFDVLFWYNTYRYRKINDELGIYKRG